MIKECPFCGSIRIVETLKGGTSICLACESIWGDKTTKEEAEKDTIAELERIYNEQ